MEAAKMSIEEVARCGEALYVQGLRAKVENEENIGKVLVIDVETGEYAIGDTGIEDHDFFTPNVLTLRCMAFA